MENPYASPATEVEPQSGANDPPRAPRKFWVGGWCLLFVFIIPVIESTRTELSSLIPMDPDVPRFNSRTRFVIGATVAVAGAFAAWLGAGGTRRGRRRLAWLFGGIAAFLQALVLG